MSRGVEARGSFWTPGVPRALGLGVAAEKTEKTGLPGASQTIRAMTRVRLSLDYGPIDHACSVSHHFA